MYGPTQSTVDYEVEQKMEVGDPLSSYVGM